MASLVSPRVFRSIRHYMGGEGAPVHEIDCIVTTPRRWRASGLSRDPHWSAHTYRVRLSPSRSRFPLRLRPLRLVVAVRVTV